MGHMTGATAKKTKKKLSLLKKWQLLNKNWANGTLAEDAEGMKCDLSCLVPRSCYLEHSAKFSKAAKPLS